MAKDRIFTNTENKSFTQELTNSIKPFIGMDYASLSKLAFALSLSHHGKLNLPEKLDEDGREIRLISIFGPYENEMKTLLSLIYNKNFHSKENEKEYCDIVKHHIDMGFDLIREKLKSLRNQNNIEEELLLWMLEFVQDSEQVDPSFTPITIPIGKTEFNTEKELHLNNEKLRDNPHTVIVGSSGSGKTQLLLYLLAEIKKQSPQINFLFFDYKGEFTKDDQPDDLLVSFIQNTNAIKHNIAKTPFPINPLSETDLSENSIKHSSREFCELLSAIETRLGPVQRSNLYEILIRAYQIHQNSIPDFQDVFQLLIEKYKSEGIADDSLIATMRDLSDFNLFWNRQSKISPISLFSQTIILCLNELRVLKDLVAFLVLHEFYKEMRNLPDAPLQNGIRSIRTILVIDEAHNYLKRKTQLLQNIIREGRSKGVVVFLASQSPSDFSVDDTEFTNFLEYRFVFKTNGITSSEVQNLLAVNRREANEIATKIQNLEKGHVFFKGGKDHATAIKVQQYFYTTNT